MSHKLGVYYALEHGFKVDRDYIAALQPPVIRLLDPDVQQIADMHALAPNAIIAPRTWAIDDGSDKEHPNKQVNRFMADPVGTGYDHANQYKAQLDRWQREARERGLTLPSADRLMFNAANEPNQGGTPDKIATYNVVFLNHCTALGIRAAALCLGVGWPDNNGPDTPVDWKPYAEAGLELAIQEGDHWLELHEYFYKSGPQDGWRWLAGRHLQCPFDVPILLGEIGVDNYVDTARWGKDGGNRGWQGHMSPDSYAAMIEYHIRNSDTRVVAALPFITDFRNNHWESFNTRAAHASLLERKDRMVTQSAPPVIAPPPVVPNGPVAIVDARAGANIRSGPGMQYPVLGTETVGTTLPIIGRNGEWWQVDDRQGTGWVNAKIVRVQNVGNVPVVDAPPVETKPTDNWQRAWPIVLRIEGGLSLDPNDSGNYYNGQLVGTKFGISAAVWGGQYDIPNLTEAQALAIYKQHYWDAAGCNVLPWPLCLIHFDTAVQHGVGVAQKLLAYQPTVEEQYLGQRALRYMDDPKWRLYGEAWGVRLDNLQDIAQESK